ncbi:hypothetical protein BDB01DRAFT_776891 [Pilobolus umbonatus]|nr:hypothetical protein BDB01DRAFT_776891 [Pilobolus umbonatus]
MIIILTLSTHLLCIVYFPFLISLLFLLSHYHPSPFYYSNPIYSLYSFLLPFYWVSLSQYPSCITDIPCTVYKKVIHLQWYYQERTEE